MKVKEEYFENYFNQMEHFNPIELLNKFLQGDVLSDEKKMDINSSINFIYKLSGKKEPDITWLTLEEVKSTFINDEIEIITTFGNVNWVDFFNSFIYHLTHNTDVNKNIIEVYKEDAQRISFLSDIMYSIFGFIDLGNEIILIEKPKELMSFNDEGKLHSVTGPAINIGDFKEYFINGDNVTPKGWSKRLRIALIDSDDTLLDNISDFTIKKIRKHIKLIDGDDIKNINEPTVFVFYLDRDIYKSHKLIDGFTQSVNMVFEERHFNAIAFFMPTDTEERIVCINPQLINEEEYKKVTETLKTCQILFDMENKEIVKD